MTPPSLLCFPPSADWWSWGGALSATDPCSHTRHPSHRRPRVIRSQTCTHGVGVLVLAGPVGVPPTSTTCHSALADALGA